LKQVPGKPGAPTAANPGRPRPGFPARLGPSAPSLPRSSGVQALTPVVGGRATLADPSTARKPVAQMSSATGIGMDSQAVRLAMVRKLEAQGVCHPMVLAALRSVERHRFVDTALVNQAYEDTSLPIGLGQTISKPNVVARMAELLCEGHSERLGRVLEIGTGCGYQAALLSHLSREVYSIERLRGLHEKARENLRTMRIANLHLILGDGMVGFAKGAPYAAIVAAAGGEDIPQAWIDQLAVGGRLVAPAAIEPGRQNLVVIDKTVKGVVRTVLEAVQFVPLKSGVA
jgi:protein-L-isoaspartate(D-aspartate) O-methyltransferase